MSILLSMLKNTFLFIPGIGEKTEKRLWNNGILFWEDLKKHTKNEKIKEYIDVAQKELKNKNIDFFFQRIPSKEHWRLYKEFRDQALFLDIETTGLSIFYDEITLIGTYSFRDGYRIFIKDVNIDLFKDYVKDYGLWITFNGKLFDVPFIKKELGIEPRCHIDLRYPLRSLGLSGSLKEIEQKLGLERRSPVSGQMACLLWHKAIKGDFESFAKLIEYNYYDVVNLIHLMNHLYNKKVELIKKEIKQRNLLDEPKCIEPIKVKKRPYITKTKNTIKISLEGLAIVSFDQNKLKYRPLDVHKLIKKIKNNGFRPLVVGIDLAAKPHRDTGFCVLKDDIAYLKVLKTNEEIVQETLNAKPEIVSIDSPLSLPKGRCCTKDSCQCRKYGITRACERMFKKRGVNIYPCLIRSMKKLTERGIFLKKTFENLGLRVIESYPGAAQDILHIPRKSLDLSELKDDLCLMGIKMKYKTLTHDQIDALTSALVGYFYLANEYEAVGDEEEGCIIVPKKTTD